MPTTPEQLIQQTSRHAVYLEGRKTAAANDIVELLADVEERVLGRLSRVDITQFSRARLEKLLSAIQGVMESAFTGDIKDAWRAQVIELADYEAGFEQRSLSSVTVNYDYVLPTATQIETAAFLTPLSVTGPDKGKLLDAFYADWTQDQITRVNGAIRAGAVQGQTTGQIVSGLRDLELPINRRNLSTMVRTGLAHASTQARQATWNRNSDIVKGERMVAVLDMRTSTFCRSIDGKVYPLGEGPRPPFHPGCRTTTVAALDDRFAFLEDDATRRARDESGVGYVDANTTYYSWLKTQPKDFIESVIGTTRTKLLLNGGISSERFAELQLNKNFKPLTLKQMKDLEPLAFMRAGLQ
tara:strand:+ start:6012 stop:7076 length:1065 start_codon:yes stop_codon:yes gene_type:complete